MSHLLHVPHELLKRLLTHFDLLFEIDVVQIPLVLYQICRKKGLEVLVKRVESSENGILLILSHK